MQILDLFAGRAFRMGKGSNWRIVHPEMGARRLTLNHGLHEPGQEFTQHLHDESEDMIVVLEGGGSVRQGDVYTPIVAGEGIFVPVGEVHGTVNDTGAPARLISFQSPPDPALYAGARDHASGASPRPPAGHRSAVRILTLAKGGPAIGQPGDWRCVISAAQGARHLGLDHIRVPANRELPHTATSAEEIFVLLTGSGTVHNNGNPHLLVRHGVLFLQHGDRFLFTTDNHPANLLRCYSLSSP
jgi:mannose-6-phosphate isomerase-like protein (cupin superfamily)